jgi:hypothetical protein
MRTLAKILVIGTIASLGIASIGFLLVYRGMQPIFGDRGYLVLPFDKDKKRKKMIKP